MKEEKFDNIIHESLDSIEPAAGAKERMLKNILAKAEQEKAEENIEKPSTEEQTDVLAQQDKKVKGATITRISKWLLPLAACLVLAFVGTQVFYHKEPNDYEVGSGRFEHADSIEEINENLGTDLLMPEELQEPRFSLMKDTAAYIDFLYKDEVLALSVSKDREDYSGVVGEGPAESVDAIATICEINDLEQTYYKIKWTMGEFHYILVNVSEASREDLISVYHIIQSNNE